MIQICIFLFLPFTSVLAYPSNNKNIDGFELSNEFLIRHFGSDFKDAVRFNIQQTGIPNTANILHKHLPAESGANRHFKRSYSVPTAQFVKQENRMPENFMKVQLLSPGEVEALEREIKGKGMYKSPIVVNLPEFGGMTPRSSVNHPKPPLLPYAPKMSPVVYQNSMHPNFLPKNQGVFRQIPQFTAHSPSAIYQQPIRPFVMKTMQPSFQQFVINSLQPSHQINLQSKNEKISLPQQANQMKNLVQPLFNKRVESPPQLAFSEKPSQEQLPYAQSTLEQSLSGQRLEENTNEPSLDQATKTPVEKTAPSTDKVQSSIDRIQPLTVVDLQPFSDKLQPSIDEVQPLIDEMQPLTHKIQPLTNKMQPPTTDKMMQPQTEKMQPSSDKMEPLTDKFHLPTIDKMQFSTERSQSSSELISPSNIAVQPLYRKVQATFEKTPDSYPNMRHPSYDELISSYHSKPSIIDEHKEHSKHMKESRFEEDLRPSFHNSRMMSFDKSSSSDRSRQTSYDNNFERAFDAFDGVKLEYLDDKKTNA